VTQTEGCALKKALELTQVGKRFDDRLFDEYIRTLREEAELEQIDCFYKLALLTKLNLDGLSSSELNSIVESQLEKWIKEGKFCLEKMGQEKLMELDPRFEKKNLNRRVMANYSQEHYDLLALWRQNKMTKSDLKKIQKESYLTTMEDAELAELTNQLKELKLEKLVLSALKQLKAVESTKANCLNLFEEYIDTLSNKYKDLVWTKRELKKMRKAIMDVDFTEDKGAVFKKKYRLGQLEEDEIEELKKKGGDLNTEEKKLEELCDFKLDKLTDMEETDLKAQFNLKKLIFSEWKASDNFRLFRLGLKKKYNMEALEKDLETSKAEMSWEEYSDEELEKLKEKYKLKELTEFEFTDLKESCEILSKAETRVDEYSREIGFGIGDEEREKWNKEFELKVNITSKQKNVEKMKEMFKKYDDDHWSNSDIAELIEKILQEGLTELEENELKEHYYLENMKKSEFDQLKNICQEVKTAECFLEKLRNEMGSSTELEEPELEELTDSKWEELKKEWQVKKQVNSMLETINDLEANVDKAEYDAFLVTTSLSDKYGLEWENDDVQCMLKDFMSVGTTEDEMTDLRNKIEQLAEAERELDNFKKEHSLDDVTVEDTQELMGAKKYKKIAKAWEKKYGLKEFSEKELKELKKINKNKEEAEGELLEADVELWRETKSMKVKSMVKLSKLVKQKVNELKKEYNMKEFTKQEFKKLKRTMERWWRSEKELNRLEKKYGLEEMSESEEEELEKNYEVERRRTVPSWVDEMRLNGRRFALLTPNDSNEKGLGVVEYPTIYNVQYEFQDEHDGNYFQFILAVQDFDDENYALIHPTSIICTYFLPLEKHHLQGNDSEALAFLLSIFQKNYMLSLQELWVYFETQFELLRTVEVNTYKNKHGAKQVEINIFPTVPIPEDVPEDIRRLAGGDEEWY